MNIMAKSIHLFQEYPCKNAQRDQKASRTISSNNLPLENATASSKNNVIQEMLIITHGLSILEVKDQMKL